jgi:hypothetical protein
MNKKTMNDTKSLIRSTIINKIKKYEAESNYRPFFQALFDENVIRQASIVQSLYTTFGMSIYEQIAVILAKNAGFHAERQYDLLGSINDETTILISKICEQPITKKQTKSDELELIRDSSTFGPARKTSISRVDVYLRDTNENEYFIDITTVKLNKKGARTLREKMLKWAAMRYSQKPNAKVKTYIGIPYNPYYPQQYNRSFVINNCHPGDILAHNEFWSLCAGYDVFDDLIGIFNEVGKELKPSILDFLNS